MERGGEMGEKRETEMGQAATGAERPREWELDERWRRRGQMARDKRPGETQRRDMRRAREQRGTDPEDMGGRGPGGQRYRQRLMEGERQSGGDCWGKTGRDTWVDGG